MDQAEQLRRIIKGSAPPKRPLARVITVTSGKGGVGKSNTAINLAIQFRKMGQKVIILDADFGLANIEIMFGAVPKHNLCDLIYQGKSISDIITWGPMEVGFISGGSGITGMSNLDKDNLGTIIDNLAELDEMTDIIIVDTGAGISDSVLEFLEPTSITDSYSLLKALSRHPRYRAERTQVKVLANKVTGEQDALSLYGKLETVVERYLKVPISYLGMIPQDQLLAKAVMQQMPVSLDNPRARSAIAYEIIAAKLMNRELDKTIPRRGMAAFFSHIISGK